MKKLFLLFILLTCFFVQAQYTAIPDANFEQALIDLGIDSGTIDGKVLTANVTNLKSLQLPGKSISSLLGIEAFVKLEKLNIDTPPSSISYAIRNKISTLDLSKNINLIELNCSNNDLTNLDTSTNLFLTSLVCKNNRITSINLSKNINLIELNCQDNDLTNLDTSTNLFLTSLVCISNRITSLDLSKNINLIELNCNYNDLTSLDASTNLFLTSLVCENNRITSLNLTKNTDLTSLHCRSNRISSLNVTKNTALTDLDCSVNQITSLDVTKNTALINLDCYGNQITSLDVTKNTALINLRCYSNQITSLDVTKNTALLQLLCYHNQLSSLDITKNTALRNLSCHDNKINNLDITKNTALIDLYCSNNQISNLDLTNNLVLETLYCSFNQISNLDLSKNTALNYLYCTNNQISNLDLTNNLVLNLLWCSNNQISSLDVTINSVLTSLYCNNNVLTSLNLKNGQNTKFIIRFLDFKSNPKLACIQVDNKTYSDTFWSIQKDATASFSENCNPPIVTASGNQIYCPQTSQKIVTSFDITDPDDTATDAVYIQISSGYVNGQDRLTLANPTLHPTIKTVWDVATGKLTLSSATSGKLVTYLDFIAAVKDVEFNNSSATPSGTRNFSINLGQANYLPSTGHYYQYVPNIGISWSNAKAAAEVSTYYGLKGYLATLLSADEAQLAGAQETGATWIGGSDVITEGTWKWVTGPEGLANGGTGTTFWIGKGNGTTTPPFNYANWDISKNQPNGSRNNEDYAQITASALGHPGIWNNQPELGDLFITSNYYPKGYIVEYGGMPGDPVLQISASTKITIPKIISVTPNSSCGSGSLLLQATATDGAVNWYTTPTGGTSIHTGNSFTTPNLSVTTSYYVDAANGNCSNEPRTEVIATMNTLPIITTTPASRCDTGSVTLEATASFGTINWYDVATAGTPIGTGNLFTTPNLTTTTTYYVEATSNGCTNSRIPVVATIYPVISLTNEVILCQSETATLTASISGMDYLWSPGGETSQSIVVSNIGNYKVIISSPLANCDSNEEFKVIEHPEPIIKEMVIVENSITIELENPENYYEFSIDGELFVDFNQFSRIPSGRHTAFVREKNGCNLIQQDFSIFSIAKYFTPNNDGFNDVWEIKEMQHFPYSTASIFDRYGKLLATLNALKPSWNGNYNNNPLTADDYWYVLKLEDSKPEIKGHFSLKR